MANVEAYRPPTTLSRTGTQGSMSSVKTMSPGAANGRIEFGLHESVMRTAVLDKVREAKQAILDSRPDPLGTRGSPWNPTAAADAKWGKHSLSASDSRLSNTLLPSHISSTGGDFRGGTCGPKFSPAGRAPPGRLDRGSAEWSTSSSSWNDSTYAPDAAQVRAASGRHSCERRGECSRQDQWVCCVYNSRRLPVFMHQSSQRRYCTLPHLPDSETTVKAFRLAALG